MKKFLSRMGIGSARVDTVLAKDTYRLGETLEGQVEIQGGSADQEVDGIELRVVTRYAPEPGRTAFALGAVESVHVSDSFSLAAGEEKSIPVRLQIPYDTPLTVGDTAVWLKTALEMDWSVDPTDQDGLEIEPDGRMRALFQAIEGLGFSLYGSVCQAAPFHTGFGQMLYFKPQNGPYADRIDTLRMVCRPSAEQVWVVMDEGGKHGGIASVLYEDGSGPYEKPRQGFTFQQPDVEALQDRLRQELDGG
jgi:sporulation-control protein